MYRMQSKKSLKWAIIALIAIVLPITWYSLKPKAEEPSYITAEVVQQDLESNVLATGTLEASKLVSVGAQVSGQVKKLYVQLGEHVKQGQLIAHIDSVQQENALKTAEANLQSLQSQLSAKQVNLEKLRAEYQRQKAMFEQDATSQAEVETALANLKTAQAEMKTIQSQMQQSRLSIATAKENVAYTRIVAPTDGTVVAVITEEGQTMNANQSAPTIVKLAKLDTMTIKAEISEADVMKVEQGQKVYFTTLGSDKKHYATLRQVEPAPKSIKSDSTTTSSNTAIYYNALFDVPNEDGKLRIDMTAQVYIVLNEAKNALTIPVAGLQSDKPKKNNAQPSTETSASNQQKANDKKRPDALELTDDEKALIDEGQASLGTVKVLENNKVIEKPVLIGLNNRVNVQILRGLNAGEQVIIADGNDKSNDNAKRSRMPPR